MYAYSRITAPFEGVVTEIDAYYGCFASGGDVIEQGRSSAVSSLAE